MEPLPSAEEVTAGVEAADAAGAGHTDAEIAVEDNGSTDDAGKEG